MTLLVVSSSSRPRTTTRIEIGLFLWALHFLKVKIHYWSFKFTLWVQLVLEIWSEHYWPLKFRKLALLIILLIAVFMIAYVTNEIMRRHLFTFLDQPKNITSIRKLCKLQLTKTNRSTFFLFFFFFVVNFRVLIISFAVLCYTKNYAPKPTHPNILWSWPSKLVMVIHLFHPPSQLNSWV